MGFRVWGLWVEAEGLGVRGRGSGCSDLEVSPFCFWIWKSWTHLQALPPPITLFLWRLFLALPLIPEPDGWFPRKLAPPDPGILDFNPGSDSESSWSKLLSHVEHGAVLPTSHTAYTQPSTLNPQPSTLNSEPSTLDPKPVSLNPEPQALNPKPQTLHPEPQHPAPRGVCS